MNHRVPSAQHFFMKSSQYWGFFCSDGGERGKLERERERQGEDTRGLGVGFLARGEVGITTSSC